MRMDKSDICNACREAAMHDGVICDCERCEVDDIVIPDSIAMSIETVDTKADYIEDCWKAIASALRIPREHLISFYERSEDMINND